MTCPDLTLLQRAAGFVTWQHFLQLAGVGLGVAGLLLFCSGLVRRFLMNVKLIEALLWTTCIGAAIAAFFVPAEFRLWPALAACLILPGAGALSVRLRKIPIDATQAWSVLAMTWGAMALLQQEQAIGFLAVAALLALLGVSVAVAPFCYFMGFRGPQALVRGTVGGALLTLAYGALAAARIDLGPLDVFRAGALWLGAFTWYLGVLILAVRRFGAEGYWKNQAVALASLVGSLTLGLLFDVREITTMASTFLIFYVAGKVVEVPVHGRIALGAKLLVAAGFLGAVWYASTKFMPVFA